jgi:hypothetical protein
MACADDVGPLDGAAHPALGHDVQHACVDQVAEMPVQARGRHIREFRPEVRSGQFPVAEEGADDPQSYGWSSSSALFTSPTVSFPIMGLFP